MRVLLALFALFASASAFAPIAHKAKVSTTSLTAERRDVISTMAVAMLAVTGLPELANAKGSSTFFFEDEKVREPSQQATGGKLDINSAFVGDYKALPGMFPHAAGKLASNGPYTSVADIYKIKGLTANDIKLFKKYEKYLTANPPGRSFDERINSRVST